MLILVNPSPTPAQTQNNLSWSKVVSKGRIKKKKKLTEFSVNDLRAMKQILYATGHLTGTRWLLHRALKFKDSHDPSRGGSP